MIISKEQYEQLPGELKEAFSRVGVANSHPT